MHELQCTFSFIPLYKIKSEAKREAKIFLKAKTMFSLYFRKNIFTEISLLKWRRCILCVHNFVTLKIFVYYNAHYNTLLDNAKDGSQIEM